MNLEKDSKIVSKALIFDASENLLLLRRGDIDLKWDLPGGHIKNKEAKTGSHGIFAGLAREVFEETGLKIPQAEKLFEFDNVWGCKVNPIHVYQVNLSVCQPEIDLTIQPFQENIDFVWVPLADICPYLVVCTYVLETSIKFLKIKAMNEEKEPWYKRKRRQERGMKKKLVGQGGNQYIPAKGMKKSSTKRSKSGPPGSPLEERAPMNTIKKIKIKVSKRDG